MFYPVKKKKTKDKKENDNRSFRPLAETSPSDKVIGETNGWFPPEVSAAPPQTKAAIGVETASLPTNVSSTRSL